MNFQQTFFLKRSGSKYSEFAGHIVSTAVLQPCHGSVKAAMCNGQMTVGSNKTCKWCAGFSLLTLGSEDAFFIILVILILRWLSKGGNAISVVVPGLELLVIIMGR